MLPVIPNGNSFHKSHKVCPILQSSTNSDYKKMSIFGLMSFTQNNRRSRKIIVVHAAFTLVHARSRSTFFGTQNCKKTLLWWITICSLGKTAPTTPHHIHPSAFSLSWMMSPLSGLQKATDISGRLWMWQPWLN